MSYFICSLIALFLAFHAATATIVPPQHEKIKLTCSTITVDPSGKGNFKTIQAAVDSVKLYGSNWTCIRVKQGIYRERVYFTSGRSFIYLIGEGKGKTIVESDGHDPLDQTATLITRTDNLIFEGITFINSYNLPPNNNPMKPAAAGKVEGDKIAFYNCGFHGVQDTLWDVSGRHYFKECTIEGFVDFIFGSGQSIYEKCVLLVTATALKGGPGYITAQGREHMNETNGFVFKYSVITGNGRTYLGRPWRDYSRVVFYKTDMADIIVPQGWNATVNQTKLVTYVESECTGPGNKTAGRVKWINKLSQEELNKLISISYINQGGWIAPQMMDLSIVSLLKMMEAGGGSFKKLIMQLFSL